LIGEDFQTATARRIRVIHSQPKKIGLWLIVLLILLRGVPSFAQKNLLVAGKMAGTVEIGSDYSKAVPSIGPASKIEPSPSDPSTKLYYHRDLLILVGNDDKVIGITVTSPAYRTPDGLGVGSQEHDVVRRLGEGLNRGNGNRTFANRGIGFSFDSSNRATQIYIFKAEGDRPLLGDRLLVAGQRAGDIRLGMKFSLIEKAWGPPTKTKELPGKVLVASYPPNSVRLVVHDGTVDGILVTTGDFITARSLKVGVTAKDVIRVLGQAPHKQKNGLFYPKLGIGFLTESNQVTEIQIIYPR
jgi:hypothetical protein